MNKINWVKNLFLENLLIKFSFLSVIFFICLNFLGIKLLKNWVDNDGDNLCGYAVKTKNKWMLRLAINSDVNWSNVNNNGKNILHLFLDELVEKKTDNNSFKDICVWFVSLNFKNIIYWIVGEGFEENNGVIKNKINLLIIDLIYFLKKKEDKRVFYNVFNCNRELLLFILDEKKISVTELIVNKKMNEMGWGFIDFNSFNINNIIGFPLELLILNFWLFFYKDTLIYNDKDFENFKFIYDELIKRGARLNELSKTSGYSDIIKDAMQDGNIRVGSSFFAKFIKTNNHLAVISILLKSETTDFLIVDNIGNNLINTIFYRLIDKNIKFKKEKEDNNLFFNSNVIEKINWSLMLDDKELDSRIFEYLFISILENKNFDKKWFEIKNKNKISTIDLLNDNNIISKEKLIRWIDYYLMSKNLSKKINDGEKLVKI